MSEGESEVQSGLNGFRKDVRALLSNRDFVILLLSFSIAVGFFNALLTLLNQIISPFGYR